MRPERVVKWLQSFFLQIDITEIILHKADEPDAGIDLLDTDGLASERFAQVNFLAIQTQTAATGNHNGFIVKGIVRLGNALLGSPRGGVDFRRTLHGEGFCAGVPD